MYDVIMIETRRYHVSAFDSLGEMGSGCER